jgi:hypothetical protein
LRKEEKIETAPFHEVGKRESARAPDRTDKLPSLTLARALAIP